MQEEDWFFYVPGLRMIGKPSPEPSEGVPWASFIAVEAVGLDTHLFHSEVFAFLPRNGGTMCQFMPLSAVRRTPIPQYRKPITLRTLIFW